MANDTPNRRSSSDIKKIFEERGCTVSVQYLGHSYRAGGEIFIFAPGVDPKSEDGFDFKPADFKGFDGTGYDGRGRHFTVWLVKNGDFIPASEAEYRNASDRKIAFGSDWKSSRSARRYFVHRDEVKQLGLVDLESAFDELGI